jgi:hypothetical protein
MKAHLYARRHYLSAIGAAFCVYFMFTYGGLAWALAYNLLASYALSPWLSKI